MRKLTFILFIGSCLLLLADCIKRSEDVSPNCIEGGVIVCQTPVWEVPHDEENRVFASIEPYYTFDGKIIVATNKDRVAGIRCMEIETGEIIWEKYFGIQGEYLVILDTYFNFEKGFLIIKVGSWGSKEHIKLDIHTGDVLWRSSIESFSGMEAYANHYYCTVRSSGDAHLIYKVDVETGLSEFFYETDLPPHTDYNAQRSNVALPFGYNGKEYLFIGIMQMTSPNSSKFYYSLMDAQSKERLLKHIPIETELEKVVVHNGLIYLFTGNGYKIFNMETLTFDEEVRLLDRGYYVYHIFNKDKLILGLDYYGISGVDDNGQSHTHFILDGNTQKKLFGIDGFNVNPSSVLDDVLYFASFDNFYAYNINTGKCVLNFQPSGWETTFCTATYKNSKGEKFVIVDDTRNTFCYKGI